MLGVMNRVQESFSVCRKFAVGFSAHGVGLKRNATRAASWKLFSFSKDHHPDGLTSSYGDRGQNPSQCHPGVLVNLIVTIKQKISDEVAKREKLIVELTDKANSLEEMKNKAIDEAKQLRKHLGILEKEKKEKKNFPIKKDLPN